MRSRNNIQRTVLRVISLLCLLGAIACGIVTAWYYINTWQSEQRYAQIREEIALTEARETGDTDGDDFHAPTIEEIENAEFTGIIDAPAPVIPEEVLTDAESSPIDFDKLSEINPELYAWIRVPGTQIDYPVAQHSGEEQTYYLHHDLYGNPMFAGCIYSEEPSAKDFSDPVTVLYGHNMKNGSMFQNLYLFMDPAVFDSKDNYIYVYTRDMTFIYEIYAAYYSDDANISVMYDFEEETELSEYIEGTLSPRSMEGFVRDDISVTEEDHILTLSTCVAGSPGHRLLVQGVLRQG